MVGPSSIAGWAVVVGFVPMQMWASKYIVRLRKSVATYTDKRMRATREALQGMKVIKFFVWEDSIASTIQGFRSQETKAHCLHQPCTLRAYLACAQLSCTGIDPDICHTHCVGWKAACGCCVCCHRHFQLDVSAAELAASRTYRNSQFQGAIGENHRCIARGGARSTSSPTT
ncbi:hypothetical protein DL89DRAFT_37353 [Linderina pennispora]|uniref:ABC transmembrane type-1 domain-containing protein n=1 Tax=Linderina pennispora TaxID=61395 RepID=A0A1Y1W2R9_9FUNG|nr:uncharacterized protein DL89DRAFT_37353 [Linderina pennispora]ORX67850.1 hypothetical protein DL89DRAFT_37353 [Linderina pennispora]